MLECGAAAAGGDVTGQIGSWSQNGALSVQVFAERRGCAHMRNSAVGNCFFR